MAIFFIEAPEENMTIRQGILSTEEMFIRDILMILFLSFLLYSGFSSLLFPAPKTEAKVSVCSTKL